MIEAFLPLGRIEGSAGQNQAILPLGRCLEDGDVLMRFFPGGHGQDRDALLAKELGQERARAPLPETRQPPLRADGARPGRR